jgi:hypothetical protein
VLRVESPGENWEVERLLLAWGADEPSEQTPLCQRIFATDALALCEDRGRVAYGRQWYLGFRKVLLKLDGVVNERSNGSPIALEWLNDPHSVLVTFDKWQTHLLLGAAGVAMAPVLEPVMSVDAMLAQMKERDWTRVFVKPWHGSSASGVVALRWDSHSLCAKSSVELERVGPNKFKLYNSLRIRRYTDERDVRAILDCIFAEGAVVERWLSKATYAGRNFDLRVVTIDQTARHAVVRVGSSPMTNLHLGNQRGDLLVLQRRVGDVRLRQTFQLCEQAAQAFSGCYYLGVDVMLSQDLRQDVVLEVNGFGDLLPGVTHNGLDTYTATLASVFAVK